MAVLVLDESSGGPVPDAFALDAAGGRHLLAHRVVDGVWATRGNGFLVVNPQDSYLVSLSGQRQEAALPVSGPVGFISWRS